ncbi:MAG TPA: hypothetical protein VGC31_02905 [Paenirhodobacter sp.]
MQRMFRSWLSGIALTVMFAASAAMLGFGHKAPSLLEQQIVTAALSGYDVADICAGAQGDVHYGSHCPACHIGDGADVPAPVALVMDAELRFVAKIVAPRESRALRTVLDPAHGVRAPPFLA